MPTKFLHHVTVTGADDSIDPGSVLALAKKYPRLEFGILLSKKQVGSSRFPSYAWQQRLAADCHHFGVKPNLSAHLCGQWVRDAFLGDIVDLPLLALWPLFQRVQLNTHGIAHETSFHALELVIAGLNGVGKQVIFQFDGANTEALVEMYKRGWNVAALYDFSHGGGILPNEWRRPFEGYCGYAGGLSPENVLNNLELIAASHGAGPAWIDAESRLFSGRMFDGSKVDRFVSTIGEWLDTSTVEWPA
jgi:phosphoribosylanthranilate isomerase